jgi:hypothetical protein
LFLAAGTVAFHSRVASALKICNGNMLGTLGTYVHMKKGQITLHGESQFDSQLPQIVNA